MLREKAKGIRANITKSEQEFAPEKLKRRVSDIISDNSHLVGTYYPIGTEIIPPHELPSCEVALPVIRDKATLEFYMWSPDMRLVRRDFDIPIPDTRGLSPVIPDIILLPLLLCDKKGNRIGYGAGHYDRYIASCDVKPKLIGVCFDEQIYEGDIPSEPHDEPLDLIVTPRRVIEIS